MARSGRQPFLWSGHCWTDLATYPEARTGHPSPGANAGRASLFGLAPCGVLPATRVTTGAVRSYRTFSPLPTSALRATAGKPVRGLPSEAREACEGGRYVFCATVRQVILPGRYPAHCPAEFGLSSLRLGASRLAQDKPMAGILGRVSWALTTNLS